MKKIRIKFKDLYDRYSTGNIPNEIHSTNKKIYTKSPSGKLIEIKGLIKKTDTIMVKVSFENGVIHKMADKHLLKTENGFKQVKDVSVQDNICVYQNSPTKIKYVEEYESDGIAYDISLDSPHEYVTPNNLIHHNTTTARILVDSIIKEDSDLMSLNGSSTTGIDTFRELVEPYLKSPAFMSPHKIVFIDEFDYLSLNAQANLRHIMEKYAEVGRFICTANYKSKILEPLHSRFQTFEMKTISTEYAMIYCESILKNENIEYDKNTVELVVQSLLPDVRKVINTLQRNVVDGKLTGVDKAQITSIEKKIVGLVFQICDSIGKPEARKTISANIPAIEKIFSSEGEPDYHAVYLSLFNSGIKPWAKIIVNKFNNTHSGCAVPQMHFMACVWETIQAGVEYFKAFGVKK